MRRLHRNLVVALLLVPAVFLSGKLLLTPVLRQSVADDPEPTMGGLIGGGEMIDQVGWPWVFCESYSNQSLIDWGEVIHFFPWALVADLAILSIVFVAIGTVVLRHIRNVGRWYQFSLLEFLLLVACCAGALGWWFRQVAQFDREQAIQIELEKKRVTLPSSGYYGPEWLRRLVPVQKLTIFDRLTSVDVDSSMPPEFEPELESALGKLQCLRRAWFFSDTALKIGDSSVFAGIEELHFIGTAANDSTFKALQPMPHLKVLEVEYYSNDNNKELTDASLAWIGKYESLETLSLFASQITSAGVAHLVGLKRLRELDLDGTAIADDAMESLVQMKSLVSLSICGTQITEPVLRRLVELPHLQQVRVTTRVRHGGSRDTLDFLKQRISNVIDE